MAKGDVFTVDTGGLASATAAVQPGSGVEWCITSMMTNGTTESQYVQINSASAWRDVTNWAGAPGGGSNEYTMRKRPPECKIFITNSEYIQISSEFSTLYCVVSGIQTK
tara:strand:+ start:408 stop:734 length:327 start_codon:yes stop_codon:yes gene_type:complete